MCLAGNPLKSLTQVPRVCLKNRLALVRQITGFVASQWAEAGQVGCVVGACDPHRPRMGQEQVCAALTIAAQVLQAANPTEPVSSRSKFAGCAAGARGSVGTATGQC